MPVTTLLDKVSEAVRKAAAEHGDTQTPTLTACDGSSIVAFETVEMWALCDSPGPVRVLHVVDPLLSHVKYQVGFRLLSLVFLYFGASIAKSLS